MTLPRASAARSAWPAAALAAVLFSFLFLPDLLEDRVLAYRDAGHYHLPIARVVGEELRAGRIPFWNHWLVCGIPLAANPNNYVYYPSRVLDLFLSPEHALTTHFLLHWALGGIATALLVAVLGGSRFASSTAAAAYLLSGPVLSLLNFANLAPYLPWIPLTAIAVVLLLRRPEPRRVVGLAICLAVQTTFAEPVFLLCEAIIVLAILSADRERKAGARAVAPAAVVVAALALLLAAPMWVPMLDLVESSARSTDRQATLGHSMSVLSLLQVPVPQLTGYYHTLEKATFWGETFNQGRGPFFLSVSLGTVVLVLAGAAAVWRGRRAWLLVLVAAIGFLLSMGRFFEPTESLLEQGAARWFRWPVKFTLIPGVLLPIAAGLGVDAIRSGRRLPAGIAAGVGVTVAIGALLLARQFLDPSNPGPLAMELLGPYSATKNVPLICEEVADRFVRTAVIALAAAILAAIAPLQTGRARRLGILPLALLGLVVLEMAPPQKMVNRGTPIEILRADPPILQEARAVASDGYRVHFPVEHWLSMFPRRPGMPDEWWPRTLLDREIGSFYHPIGERIPMVLFNPDRLVTEGAVERERAFPLLGSQGRTDFEQLLAIGARVKIAHAALTTGRAAHATTAGWPVSLAPLPGALRIPTWLESLPEIADPGWSPVFVTAWREHLRATSDPEALRITERASCRWTLETTADRSGFVGLSETRDPGWTAKVDGVRTEIVPYLGDFMAVAVPAGTHVVEWTYRPRHFPWLVASTLLGLVLAGITWRFRMPSAEGDDC